MVKRTQIKQYKDIEKADDLEQIVVDKRKGKRANKAKAKRRKRHYSKALMKHLSQDVNN